ncbi:MAG: hypothetical protein HYY25_05605 [Candidatus Wallbacteria bacterium]|nr:hypothetical protein [Candidatus Wallbacteria bacterium]
MIRIQRLGWGHRLIAFAVAGAFSLVASGCGGGAAPAATDVAKDAAKETATTLVKDAAKDTAKDAATSADKDAEKPKATYNEVGETDITKDDKPKTAPQNPK